MSNYKIIIRPHPEEDLETYRRAFEHDNKINIVYSGSVIPWLMATEIMIHPDCTTGIESLMLGKKSVSYLPKGLDQTLLTSLPMKTSYTFQNESQVIEFILKKNYVENLLTTQNDEWLNNHFNFFQNSTEIIINKLLELKKHIAQQKNFVGISLINYLKIRLKHVYSNTFYPFDALLINKLKGFNSRNLFRVVHAVDNEHPFLSGIKAVKVNNHLYKFVS